MKMFFHFGALLVLAGGCSEQAAATSDIGMVDVQVHETTSSLEIIGLDARARTVAHLDLKLGRFHFDDQDRDVEGRQMDIAVLGETTSHQSAGFNTLSLPLFVQPEYRVFNSFLGDSRVQPVLAAWGVTFSSPPDLTRAVEVVPSEVSSASCSYAPTQACGATSCAQSNEAEFYDLGCISVAYQYVCCGNTHQAAERACSSPNTSGPCGNTGPGGCATCWNTTYGASCTAWTSGSAGMRWCYDAQPIPYFPEYIQISY